MINFVRNSPKFRRFLYHWYAWYGRHNLPWRQTADPYAIWVAEIMLQQTQVERVIPKYLAWLEAFPTIRALAEATQTDVLHQWIGLGYNRRALYLHRAAKIICIKHGEKVPETSKTLKALPGIGPNTTGSILAFGFNQPAVFVEVNIRRVVIHHFFADQKKVTDQEIRTVIERILDRNNPRKWYSAMMDYGSWLKIEQPKLLQTKSTAYQKQSAFKGSNRQVRSMILKTLIIEPAGLQTLAEKTGFPVGRIKKILAQLEKEKFITRQKQQWHILSR